jgi:DNA polymerase-3 subunit gamma/tau
MKMTSQSLYRKWRSQTFGDLVGQEPVIRTLKNALNSDKLAHAYIFTGPRGTGKTSTARLLAKTINCLNPKDGEPCNICEQCREITAGSSFNVLEIDAASNRGIDSIRELREKVMVPPTTGKYKIYILDEAHMLTTEAFNALLKTLEEPPPHAIFVMATTDVHKMLPTVLSRCQRFDFKRITTRQIVTHLHFVAQQEKVELDRGAAELIARAAAGGMRDALSLLDQAIAYSGNVIALSQIQAMLGVADPRAIQKFILHIADLDSPAGLHLIHELAEAGADLRQINTQVAEYWRAMMLAKAGANIAEILDYTEDENREVLQLAKRFGLDELTECARIFAQNDLMQRGQGTPQLGLELAMLACIELHRRSGAQPTKTTLSASVSPSPPQKHIAPPPVEIEMVESRNEDRQAQPASRSDVPILVASKLEEDASISKVVEPMSAPVETELVELDEEPENVEVELPDWDGLSIQDDEEPEEETTSQELVPVDVEVKTEEEVQIASVGVDVEDERDVAKSPTLTVGEVKDKWEYVIRRVRTKKGGDGAKVSAFLKGFTIEGIEGTSELPVVVIKAIAEFHYKALQKDEYSEMILWAMKIELGIDCKLRMLSPSASSSNRPGGGSAVAASNMLAAAPPRSAHLERPRTVAPSEKTKPTPPPQPQANPTNKKPVQQSDQDEDPPPSPVASAPKPDAPVTPSLARISDVRENTSNETSEKRNAVEAGETRQQRIEQHVKSDPVIQEVMRVFKAEIKSIQPK